VDFCCDVCEMGSCKLFTKKARLVSQSVNVLFIGLFVTGFQINFFKDHTKVIISAEKHGYMVTYINGDRLSCSYWLAHIAQFSCETNIYDRLRFAAAVVHEFAELDGEEV